MKGRNISMFIAGFVLGAVAMWAVRAFTRPPMDELTETSILRAPGIAVWYKSFHDKDDAYLNEFHFRKLCGDAQKPCSPWLLAGVTHSDRPYPSKDVEVQEGGGNYLMQMPDGYSIKGSVEGPWTVEPPPK
jgi:hypothetical protein